MKKKNVKWLALLMVMIFVLTGCGASSDKAASTEESPMEYGAVEDTMVEEEAAVEMETTGSSGMNTDELEDSNRKLIKRYHLNLETREYDELIEYIQESVNSTGGYIESSNLSGTSIDGYGSRYAYFVLRVPVSDAPSFIVGLEKNGHVTHKSEEVEDVTLAYVDTESRIEALRIEQETLMKMLEEAESLDTILGIQSRLTEVRYELESYESQIRSYDNLIEYTTVSVDVYEVKRETSTNGGSFIERLKDNFSDGIYNFGQGMQNFIIWFAGAVPSLLLLTIIVVVVILVLKKMRTRKAQKEEFKKVLKHEPAGAETWAVLNQKNEKEE